MGKTFISKSRFLNGLQCSKLLWTQHHARELIPEVDASTQAIFDQGHEVGALAKKRFPAGIEIEGNHADLEATLNQTQKLLSLRRPLFEAAFSHNGGYCRVDVLNPAPNGAWDLIEVKSTADVKDIHLEDLAFQTWVLKGAGLKIRRCFLCHINSGFVKSGDIDPEKFFTLKDVTAEVVDSTRVKDRLDQMFKVLKLAKSPEVSIGGHCRDPYECPLTEHCWGFLPEANVFTLYRGGAKGFDLLKNGIHRLVDIPDEFKLSENQEIQRETLRSGKPYIDRAAISAFLSQLKYPVSYLDFETIGMAIPLFDNSRPYQQIPFQYSLHVVRAPKAKPGHFEFLAEGVKDPRPAFMEQLRAELPESGSVVAYNAAFETARLAECGELLPQHKTWLGRVNSRIVDLLVPFRGFRYYHPSQNGTASMKAVLPALTGAGYDALTIREGGTASQEFLRVTFGDLPRREQIKGRNDLKAYCGLDTEGMIRIVKSLQSVIKS